MEDYERRNARAWNGEPKPPPAPPVTYAWKEVVSGATSRYRPPPNNTPQQQQRRREAAKAAAWQVAGTGAVRRGHNARREPPKLAADSDNDAEATWRSRAKPLDSVRIPDDMILRDKSDDGESWHILLAKQHKTFVYSDHPRGSGGSRTFGIWGEKSAVAATKRAIADYIEESGYGAQSSARSAKFAKIHSLTPKLRKRAEKRWRREVAKQKFRQHPSPDMTFRAIGSFLWPVAEYKPEDVLGTHFEALDPVRMDLSCYVVFHKERNRFRIMGRASEVKEGVLRLRRICFQIAAKQISSVRLYLNHWPNGELPAYIYLEGYTTPAIISGGKEGEEDGPVIRKAPRGDEYEPDQAHTMRASTVAETRLLKCLLRTLGKLRYYQGHVQLRIRLGTFLVDWYKEPGYGVYDHQNGEYEDMLKESQFSGEVTQEVGHKATEDAILPALQDASDLLMPAEAMTASLKDIKPIYAATFNFADPAGHYRLVTEWQETPDAYRTNSAVRNFDSVSKKWTRLERDAATPTPLFDVSLCDLSSSSAWQFGVFACPKVLDETKLPQQLSAFTKNLRIEPKRALDSSNTELFVRYNPYASLASVQQSVKYQYTISNTDFTLELARFQIFTYPSREAGTSPTVQEPRWSVNVYRKAWDAMLAENERLAIGKQVEWKVDDVTEWFPIDLGPGSSEADGTKEQGWRQLLQKLQRVEDVVKDVKGRTVEGASSDGGNNTV